MPRSVAAGISMLSVPNPDVDTTTSSFPASSTSAVTRSGVRTHKARAPYKTCLISSTLLLSTTTTSAPPSASSSWPAGSYIDLQSTTFPLDTAAMLPQPLSTLNDNVDDPFPLCFCRTLPALALALSPDTSAYSPCWLDRAHDQPPPPTGETAHPYREPVQWSPLPGRRARMQRPRQ